MNVTVGRGCIARALAPVRVIEVKAIDHRHVDFPPFHRRVAIVDDLHVLDLVRAVPYDLRARGAIDRWLPAGAVRVGGAEKEDARRERKKERRGKRERRERREREERDRGERQRERERERRAAGVCVYAYVLSLAGTCTLTNSSTRAHTHRQLNLVCPGDSIRSRLPSGQGTHTREPLQVI